MFYTDFSECHSLLRMLEMALDQPYKSFSINVSQGKARIEKDGSVPFIATWQGPLELAVTINAMLAVLDYKNRIVKRSVSLLEKCSNGRHANPHVDCFLR